MTSCTCQLPSVDPHRPSHCEQCGGALERQMARIALGAIGHELHGVHLRLEAVEQTSAAGSIEVSKRLGRLEDQLGDLMCYVKPDEQAEPWISADDIAAWIGWSAEWVRDNGQRLGGIRAGDGPKARWRFRRSLVEAALRVDDDSQSEDAPAPLHRRRRRRDGSIDLLPIKGRAA